MLAAGRTYGQGLARSTLSVSRCSRLIAPGPDTSALSRIASAYPVSTQVARHSGGGGAPPDDGWLPQTVQDEHTPWLKYQSKMYQRTGLQGFDTRRRRRRRGAVSPTTASATAGVPVKGEALNAAPSSFKRAPTAVSAITPAASTTTACEGLNAANEGGSRANSSSSSAAAATGDQVLQTAERAPTSLMTNATHAETSSQAAPTPPCPPSTVAVPRPPWESSSSGSVGGSVEKPEQIVEMEAELESRTLFQEEAAKGKGGAQGGGGSSSSREAALNAELERKFGQNPGHEPEPEPVSEGRRGQSAPSPSHWETSSELGAGDENGDGGSGSESDPSTAATRPDQTKRRSLEFPKAGKETRSHRRMGPGKKRGREVDVGVDGAVSEGSESKSGGDLRAEDGGAPKPESDVEVGVGNAAAGGGAGFCATPRKPKHSRWGTLGYYQLPGSAWNNVHSRKNLNLLLRGLKGDHGVKEMLAAHHVSENTLSKLLPMFHGLVLDDPNNAFEGKGCQKIQKAISRLCYHRFFTADAVLMRKPIRGESSSGKTFVFPSTAGKWGKRGRETDFVKKRNDLVEYYFIPRLVHLAQAKFPEEIEVAKKMDAASDLRNPHQAYPLARLRRRRIIYHGGPTNSGKTYQAIERLKKAGANRQPGDGPAGLFCGPLRLLALEVYEQLNSQGVYCSLMTGQEKRQVPFATHVSCTIEMASTENEYEVAVVDEIQMLADEERGPSWTAAILGLNCPEIHVCGGMEGADLVEAMAREMGDDFELREYQRKTELVCAEESLSNSYKNIQSGDAVVAFSRQDIFNIKREIERKTPHKCCVIFGSLPQETRALQARLFNMENTGYDVLVASDAIGMGLNLNIRRVVFHTVVRRGGGGGRTAVKLRPTLLKQIGGRAGRHGKQWEFGEVTCLKAIDMPYMNQVMNTPLEPLTKAAIFPSVQRIQDFSNCLDQEEPEDQERRRLAETYAAFAQKAKVGDRYFLGSHHQYQTLANSLHPIEDLTLKERYAISMAPVNSRNPLLVRAIFLFASAHAAGLPVFINMQLPQKGVFPNSMDAFQTLCSKHNVLNLYSWMGVRFPSIECFAEKSVADIQKLELEWIINEALKRKITVAGPDSISTPEHDTFDKGVIRALNRPGGDAF